MLLLRGKLVTAEELKDFSFFIPLAKCNQHFQFVVSM